MLKLKLQTFGYLMQRANSLQKTLMLGKIGGRRRRGRQKMGRFDGITDSMDMSLSRLLTVSVGCAPFFSQVCAFSALILISAGLVMGL